MAINHLIRVSFTPPNIVRAVPNPAPSSQTVNRGDTVTWLFENMPAGRELQLLFANVISLAPPGTLEPCNPLGPFENLSRANGTIVGTVRDVPTGTNVTRYFYRILANGVPLEWAPAVPGAPDKENGGGLDTPGKPPGT